MRVCECPVAVSRSLASVRCLCVCVLLLVCVPLPFAACSCPSPQQRGRQRQQRTAAHQRPHGDTTTAKQERMAEEGREGRQEAGREGGGGGGGGDGGSGHGGRVGCAAAAGAHGCWLHLRAHAQIGRVRRATHRERRRAEALARTAADALRDGGSKKRVSAAASHTTPHTLRTRSPSSPASC